MASEEAMKFDAVIAELVNHGCESWDDLTPQSRARLVRLYFAENPEWGDAFFEGMDMALDAFETRDVFAFGLIVGAKMDAYARPYINKQLAYQALCRREAEEVA
jgi:hypothetical protein